jgi:ABC-2 type transport system permease protein
MRPTSSPPDLAPGPDGALLAAALPRARSPVLKYLKICRSSLTERMAYRADFMVSTFLRFLPMLTTILLWMAVFTGAAAEGQTAFDVTLGGFDLNEMISYLLLVHISRMFSSMPGLAHGIARDIRDGGLKKYLIQPVEMLPYLLSYRVAHKAAYITMTALPYALLFWLCRDFLPGWPDAATLAAYALALVLGFLVGFYFEASIGMLGFWLLEVSSFLYVINTLTFFLSGHMFPFDLLPEPFVTILKHLPFQYLAYFPAAVFLGKIQGEELLWGLLAAVGWAAAFMVMASWLYRRGLRHYSAYGG